MSALVVAALRAAGKACTGLPAAHLDSLADDAGRLPEGRDRLRHAIAYQLERVDGKAGRENVAAGRENVAAAYRGALAAVDEYRAPAGAEV